jgi:hypothetical protein
LHPCLGGLKDGYVENVDMLRMSMYRWIERGQEYCLLMFHVGRLLVIEPGVAWALALHEV